jgi:hypothetical protein
MRVTIVAAMRAARSYDLHKHPSKRKNEARER